MAEDLEALFAAAKEVLVKASKGLDVRKDTDASYELYGRKKVTAYNKEMDGIYFATIVRRKGSVSFYFFPVYTHPDRFGTLAPELEKCRSGKSCFQLKKAATAPRVRDLVARGEKVYKEIGWI